MKVILLFVAFFVVLVAGQIGNDCKTSNNKSGKCVLLGNCKAALDGLKRGEYPKTCGYQGTVPIVCCEGQTQQRQIGDMAKKKCREYAEYRFDVFEDPAASFNTELIKIDECGIIVIPLIVGGEKAAVKEFPHMARLGYGNPPDYRCGGSLISENFVLTAGHCLYDRDLGAPVKVAIGMNNMQDRTRQVVDVVQIIDHPSYKPPSHYNDIGLIKIKGAQMTPYARPACLNTLTRRTEKSAIASGWGKIGFTEGVSENLLKVTLEYFSQSACNRTFRSDYGSNKLRNGIQDDTQMCAGSSKEFKDTCQGDSGGPLQVFHDSSDAECMYDLVGVTSFGKACGLAKNLPGVYTRISTYIKWIEDNVWPN